MRNEEYPAIGGLAGVGKPAVPVLLKTIGKGETELERENAMYALMTIDSGHPAEAIGLLRKTADAEPDTVSTGHLREAAAKAETIWCKARDKCANAAD